MASVLRNALKSIREKGIGNYFRELREEGYLQTKIHNIGATLVGVDKFGNKYYQKLGDTQYGVNYYFHPAALENPLLGMNIIYRTMADIGGWNMLIRIATMLLKSRQNGMLLLLKPKRYGVEHKENFSGEGDEYIYHSKGHTLNAGQRDWTRYQPWQPKKA